VDRAPSPLVPPGGVAPVPRRIRAFIGNEAVVDSVRAVYAWEHPSYPQYYIPLGDLRADLLASPERTSTGPFGPVEVRGVRTSGGIRPGAAQVLGTSSVGDLDGTVRLDWDAFDAWFEEDEQVFVHPRNPYTRVDAVRSTRVVQVAVDGVLLAESQSPVMVFETGLPTRYYLNPTEVDFSHLLPSATVTRCPYKGTTTGYWSACTAGQVHADVAWSYGFPTSALAPIAGLVAFYNEQVDITLDGQLLDRPRTHRS